MDNKITDRYAIYRGDCIELIKNIPDESIHLTIYSPPFASLYTYSSYDNDLGNANSYEEFLQHYEFLISEIARVTLAGRISCVHCMDLPTGNNYSGFRDFPGDIIRLYQKYGFDYQSRYVIWKEPLKMALRTRSLGLMHRQLVKDSSLSRVAAPDYLLAFRKIGNNPIPISHPTGLNEFYGDIDLVDAETKSLYINSKQKFANWTKQETNKLSQMIWRQYASSYWINIRAGRLLPFKEAKGEDDQKHVCPLQLDIIDRCILLWSNKDETVLTPFMGIGSEVYCAVKQGRKGIGFELKETYFNQSVRNLQQSEINIKDENNLFTEIESEDEPD